MIVTTGAQDELSIPGQVLSLANQLKETFPVDFFTSGWRSWLIGRRSNENKRDLLKNKLQPLLISGCSLFFCYVCLNDLVLLLMKASARAKSPA